MPKTGFSIYRPILSHWGYPTETFITPTFGTIPNNGFKNDFSFSASTTIKNTSGILLSADIYNRSFIPKNYKMIGIVPTKTFVENRLAVCWAKKISDEEYFYVGPSVRSIDISTDFYIKESFESVRAVSKGQNNFGFLIGYNRIFNEILAVSSNVGIFNYKHNPFMYSVDLNFVAAQNVAFNLGSSDSDIHGGISLINNWGKIGYKTTYFNNDVFHSIFCGLALNY